MDVFAEGLRNPWLPYAVLGAAFVVTLGAVVPQLRMFAAGLRALLLHRSHADGPLLLLATAAGLGGIAGTALALQAGGPGALVWLWIASALGMSLHWAEGAAAAKSSVTPAIAERLGGLGKPLAALVCLAFVATAALLGGTFQTHQASALLQASTSVSTWAIAVPMALIGLACALSSGLRRIVIVLVVPLALLAWIAITTSIFAADLFALQLRLGDAFNQAFGLQAVAAGTTTGVLVAALHHGMLRAVMGTGIGLGTATFAPVVDERDAGYRPGAAAMLVPLLSALAVSTTTGFAMLTATALPEPVIEGRLTPMERAHSRGLRPSQQVGQTIVLPEDTTMVAGEHYAMQLRANPRGHQFARLLPDDNVIILPKWKVAENVDTVVFRSRDPERADDPAWDVRLDVTFEVIEGKGGPDYLKLSPIDPELDLGKLAAHYELNSKPYVVLDDFEFTGRVGQARSGDESLGDHLAMFEPELTDRPFNPKLHEFFRGGFRGPYAASDEPRPPWGWVAREGLDAEIGSTLQLELRADPRGNDLVRVNRAGGVEGPPWDFLLDARALVLRHAFDPTKDVTIQAQPELDGVRVRFDPLDDEWDDMRRLERMPELSGPYVLVDDQRFEAEVHGDVRLEPKHQGRRTLVAVHPQPEPTGPTGTLPYRPHPAELLDAGFAGPFVVHEAAASVGQRLRASSSTTATAAAVVAILLGIGALAAWSVCAGRSVAFVLGQRASVIGPVLVASAAAVAAVVPLRSLLAWVDTTMALVLVPNLLAIALSFQWGRGARGAVPPADPKDPREPAQKRAPAANDDA